MHPRAAWGILWGDATLLILPDFLSVRKSNLVAVQSLQVERRLAMLRHALKEWAVICRALGEGRQAILLRKGGITESEGEFRLEHRRFWLYPTYLHQQQDGITADARAMLEEVEQQRPPQGVVRLEHFAEV